jgi:hypothetical protein
MEKQTMTKNFADDKEKNPGFFGSGTPGTGPAIPAGNDRTTNARKHPAPRLVQRATALRGLGIGRSGPKSSQRRQTLRDIMVKDAEIPYVKFEAAVRDLVCSLMERQDRMNEEIFYRINDLGYRIEDLEQERLPAGGGA